MRFGILPNLVILILFIFSLVILGVSSFLPTEFHHNLAIKVDALDLAIDYGPTHLKTLAHTYALNLIVYSLLGAVALFFFFGFQILVSRGKWLGMGDLKLSIPLGILIGWPQVLVFLIISYVLGGLVSILLLFGKKKKLNEAIPFGPVMIIAAIITIFFGPVIYDWYWLTFIK